MDERESTSLVERDHLMKLLNLLDSEKTLLIDAKRRLAAIDQRFSMPASPSSIVPSVTGLHERLQTFYVDRWPEVKVQRGDTILFPSRHLGSAMTRTIGGTPISLETAVELRKIVYGTPHHSFSQEWRKSTLEFQDIDGPYPYGIQTQRCGSRGLALCIQGYLLKHLFFDREYKSSLSTASSLKPNSFERRRALIEGMCTMLWQAGEKRRSTVVLMEEEACFGPDYRYRFDNLTERLHVFEFRKLEEVKSFVKRNLDRFQEENGCGLILFLYSLVLSRTIQKVREDMDISKEKKGKLLTDMEDLTISLLNLALTGHAVSFLHNGDILYDSRGNALPRPLKGVQERSHIGFMFWDKGEEPDRRTEVGSMLKTPKTPIWVTKVNQMYGLLFSTNLDLVNDWRIENWFTLSYYTGLVSQPRTAILNIETRRGRPRPKTTLGHKQEENRIPPLENCIMTKWYGAYVGWNGTLPFI
ncbi:inactive ubiquitin carboxyl-terminal hydrolase MINDY-4B-like isoform X2 [Pomacea canaliculata]|uniref:inactive ubiquitin carboxyl-terminal hydrolase MINDY-4B-like isoform X2 n=1 Tax=Pomacea canaliculata TaxID=400727 RepID=UPI000D72CAAB|nr:inactive ubiquitin carboxyl-terminal hydrolase MINDY-4B-like isoform X2 [Pomacea canaliculata]